jgi:hypothetical protein
VIGICSVLSFRLEALKRVPQEEKDIADEDNIDSDVFEEFDSDKVENEANNSDND